MNNILCQAGVRSWSSWQRLITVALSLVICCVASGRDQVSATVGPSPAAVSGRVLVDGRPTAGVKVMLGEFEELVSDSATLPGEPLSISSTISGANGEFRFAGLRAGQYCLDASAQSLVFEGRPLDTPFLRSIDQSFQINAGEFVSGLTLNLRRTGVITGRVSDKLGRPVVGTNVEVVASAT